MRPQRITVLYNRDFDASNAVDASSVEGVAQAIAGALRESGSAVEVVAIHGREISDVLARMRDGRPDLVFNLCESLAGVSANEPTLAGLLDLHGIPYTGADLLALASCLHKHRAKEILVARGVATPPYVLLDAPAALDDRALDALDYPWFVKLDREDASVGITEANVVGDAVALRARASQLMREYAQPVLAERFVEGREVNVTLLGNGRDTRVLPLHEIDFAAMPDDRPRIVSYAAKWDESHVDYEGTKPVPLRGATTDLVATVERVARGAWTALGLRDYGRVDLRIDAAGQPWVIDVNPNCDLSPDAGVARSARVAGMTYAQLVDAVATAAWQRYRALQK